MPDQSVCSVIIPTLNEEEHIGALLEELTTAEDSAEIVVADGGSTDATQDIVRTYPHVHLLSAGKGRALQMNVGAKQATTSKLVFLHADTRIPNDFLERIKELPENSWGYFKIKLSGNKRIFRVIEFMMNWRCRLTHVITGDMVLVIDRSLFINVGGYPEVPLMEDIDISKQLRKLARPHRFDSTVTTSSRRWESNGTYKTIWMMWTLRLGHFFNREQRNLIDQYKNKL